MAAPDEIALWDAEAERFDEPADHGLHDLVVRTAWRELLLDLLPGRPARVADLGCGTATLALLLAEAGFEVDALDFSPQMVELARRKTQDTDSIRVVEADVFDPPLPAAGFDAVLCRHVLRAMPDPAVALDRWIRLLAPGGVLVLVEGRWSNGAGLTAEQTVALVEAAGCRATLTRLTDPAYWGRSIEDDRYVVTGSATATSGSPGG
jgi:ubiquinone/menaquinone biosynthesis C-methylase UbiE